MRVIFAGTPAFAARALAAIVAAGHEVPLVLTQPDRPAGRNQRLSAGAVKQFAESAGLAVYQPERLKTPDQQSALLAVRADAMVVAAYGLILPDAVLDHPRHGCINIHASLLPRWRGAAPIQRAILAADTETGISIMQMDAGLDTGPVISRHPVAIAAGDTSGTLHDKLAAAGAAAIVATLAALERDGCVAATPQADDHATYAPKVEKREAQIDWNLGAAGIDRRIRAFNPAPGASTTVEGAILKIWGASMTDSAWAASASDASVIGVAAVAGAAAGEVAGAMADEGAGAMAGEGARAMAGEVAVIAGRVVVRCGDGRLLVLEEVQPASGRRMKATEYLKRRTNREMMRLGT